MKYKDILKSKVVYSENLGDSYYWDYKIIVQIDKKRYVLLEYNDSSSGYYPFDISCYDKEFLHSFFSNYYNEVNKIKLDYESKETLEELVDFEFEKQYNNNDYTEDEIIILDYDDIKEYIIESE